MLTGRQMDACGSPVVILHGAECVPYILPEIYPGATSKPGMEILDWLLRDTSDTEFGHVLHSHERQGKNIWTGNSTYRVSHPWMQPVANLRTVMVLHNH
jgi:hypothetical protein